MAGGMISYLIRHRFDHHMDANNYRKESLLSLEAKIHIAETVISDALNRFVRPLVIWSGGKDSGIVLHLTKEVAEGNKMKIPPTLFIDHGDHFPETIEFMDRVSKEWGVKIITCRNDDVLNHISNGKIFVKDLNDENRKEIENMGLKESSFDYSLDTVVGNHLLKTIPMRNCLANYRFDAVFTGVRWDENPARSSELFMSPRKNPEHIRVHPILPFTERDVWNYNFKFKLPVNPLYSRGYRSIDGKRDSVKSGDKPAWEQNLDDTSERAGRSQEKEKIMDRLRTMGYM